MALSFSFVVPPKGEPEMAVYLENKIVISPNPAISATKVYAKNNSQKIKRVQVFSMVNEKVIERNASFPSSSMELNVMKLPNAKYFVKVLFTDGSEEIAMLIKTK